MKTTRTSRAGRTAVALAIAAGAALVGPVAGSSPASAAEDYIRIKNTRPGAIVETCMRWPASAGGAYECQRASLNEINNFRFPEGADQVLEMRVDNVGGNFVGREENLPRGRHCFEAQGGPPGYIVPVNCDYLG